MPSLDVRKGVFNRMQKNFLELCAKKVLRDKNNEFVMTAQQFITSTEPSSKKSRIYDYQWFSRDSLDLLTILCLIIFSTIFEAWDVSESILTWMFC